MKKIVLILFSIFMLSSLNSSANQVLVCANNECTLITYHTNDNGDWVIESMATISMCDGSWTVALRLVSPGGAAPCPETSVDNYAKLNTESSYKPSDLSTSELTAIEENESSFAEEWINPFKLSSQAFAAIYGSAVMDMFYVHTAVSSVDGSSLLKLYSDATKTVTVYYKTTSGTLITSESVSVIAGSNCIALTAPTSLSNGMYVITVTSSASSINTALTVSH